MQAGRSVQLAITEETANLADIIAQVHNDFQLTWGMTANTSAAMRAASALMRSVSSAFSGLASGRLLGFLARARGRPGSLPGSPGPSCPAPSLMWLCLADRGEHCCGYGSTLGLFKEERNSANACRKAPLIAHLFPCLVGCPTWNTEHKSNLPQQGTQRH